MTSVEEQLHRAECAVWHNTGVAPTKAYLGTKMYDLLRIAMEPYLMFKDSQPKPPGVVAVWRGVNIYLVMDDPDHLQVV